MPRAARIRVSRLVVSHVPTAGKSNDLLAHTPSHMPGTESLRLWSHIVIQAYPLAVDAACRAKTKLLEGEKLRQLEAWWRDGAGLRNSCLTLTNDAALPCRILTKDEMMEVVRWKLAHGKLRPTLLSMVSGNDEAVLQEALRKALLLLHGAGLLRGEEVSNHVAAHAPIMDAIAAMSAPKGIGPATASAILNLYSDHVCFMSDEALASVQGNGGGLKYTLVSYRALLERLSGVAAELNAAALLESPENANVISHWHAGRVEQALWTWHVLQCLEPTSLPAMSTA
jgi:hypothetical protein